MLPDTAKNIFLSKYSEFGDDRFFKFLLNYAFGRAIEGVKKGEVSPEVELLNFYERFLAFYRKESMPIYLSIARVFRRAAHKVYYMMLSKKLARRNKRFLNLVK
jgi:hypothetical protein